MFKCLLRIVLISLNSSLILNHSLTKVQLFIVSRLQSRYIYSENKSMYKRRKQ